MGLIAFHELIAYSNKRKGIDVLCVELAHDPLLRGFVGEVVIGELEWDVVLVEELFSLLA